ncbi:hypothetical protein WICPIJ_000789 [Wickerhamomyces pijperi]|uniref:Uncharacterized protein n=1 Tax=Wickerhamomyces pijperi TaxID=599730 RepID=A0A9P8QC58_WICPI|nr:hypothetical protein WICPIJ_000789 [Wickerhamomyces pijperi]
MTENSFVPIEFKSLCNVFQTGSSSVSPPENLSSLTCSLFIKGLKDLDKSMLGCVKVEKLKKESLFEVELAAGCVVFDVEADVIFF